MRISFDPAKRHKTFEDRGLAFEDAALVFAGVTLELEDTREDYGETRVMCYGWLQGRMLWWVTPRVARIVMYSV